MVHQLPSSPYHAAIRHRSRTIGHLNHGLLRMDRRGVWTSWRFGGEFVQVGILRLGSFRVDVYMVRAGCICVDCDPHLSSGRR